MLGKILIIEHFHLQTMYLFFHPSHSQPPIAILVRIKVSSNNSLFLCDVISSKCIRYVQSNVPMFFTKQGFEILEFGSICFDTGKVSLSDKEDCQKAAVFQGYPFKRTKNVRDYPKGCYLDIWNDGVYWNPNKDGRSHMAAAEICYRSGNYCRKLMIEFS